MSINILIKREGSVYEAIAYDESGQKIDTLIAFTESNARRLLKEKLGMIKAKKPKEKKEKRTPSTLLDSGSVMRGLQGVTSSRPWKKTK